MCFRFGGLKSLPLCVDDLFRRIPFSHEDKIHEHIKESLLPGRRTKGDLACCFRSFLQIFERSFLQKISYFLGIKQGSFQHHCFDIQGARFFQTTGIFIDSPGICGGNFCRLRRRVKKLRRRRVETEEKDEELRFVLCLFFRFFLPPFSLR